MNNRLLSTLAIAMFFAPFGVFAQDSAYVEKLERRLMALEQKMYNQQATSSGSGNPAMLADLEARMQMLEEESSKVYGAVEELGNTVEQFAKKMELISKDFDLRLQDLEKVADQAAQNAEASKNAFDAGVDAPVSSKLTDRVVAKNQKAPSALPSADSDENGLKDFPSSLPAKEHYDAAYKLIVATQYKQAEKAMSLFLDRHGDDDLADNAYYWLGEVYLVQNQPEKAVITFSKGLAKFPQGAKAPGNLLKMGVAFKAMKKNDFAKSSWEKLLNDYPNAAEAEKAKKELEQLK